MNIKNTTLAFFSVLSVSLFAQVSPESQPILKIEPKLSYLDSIKKTFVHDKVAARVDSLWMQELHNSDLFASFSEDIKNTNLDLAIQYELPTELLKQRLAAMDAKSPFNIEYNPGLENIIKSFLKNRKKSFERLMAVSEYYFPVLEEALAKQNIPLEIKYLAVVESALNPKAVSKMGATGIWQFMYHTAKQYGLKIDSYVDERSDPLKASAAATQYMTNMYKIFGDWDLVLAAYNSGPGNVAKAIRRSGGQQNYWNIRKNLPKETQGYVPAFLATMYMYEYHKEHGIVPNKAKVKHFQTDTVMIKQQMTFKQISELLDVPIAQLQVLNPSYKLNVVPFYHDQTYFLRLPQDKVALFTSNEGKIYAYAQHEKNKKEKPFMLAKAPVVKDSLKANTTADVALKSAWHKVKKGENLASIALKYGVTIADIKQTNQLKGNAVAYGKILKINTIPTVLKDVKPDAKNAMVKNTALADAKSTKDDRTTDVAVVAATHVVSKGDNLNSIAKKNNMTVAELQKINGLTSTALKTGMVLQVNPAVIDAQNEVATAPLRQDVQYVVLKGDNLGMIATKFGATIPELKAWNNLPDNTITIGKSLIVAKDEIAINTDKATVDTFKTKKSNAAAKTASEYFVKKGDSLFSISKKYPGVTINDLKKWNDISGEDIKPGMKLKISG